MTGKRKHPESDPWAEEVRKVKPLKNRPPAAHEKASKRPPRPIS